MAHKQYGSCYKIMGQSVYLWHGMAHQALSLYFTWKFNMLRAYVLGVTEVLVNTIPMPQSTTADLPLSQTAATTETTTADDDADPENYNAVETTGSRAEWRRERGTSPLYLF
jgi:hypothetical protein